MHTRASIVATLTLVASALMGCGTSSDQTAGIGASAGSGPAAGASPSAAAPAANGPVIGDKNRPMPAPGTCKMGQRNGLAMPDPHCTPGAVDVVVTQANLTETICKPDWRERAYPAVPVDARMKSDSARAYGLPSDFDGEYDHLVSRMLGGSSEDPRNRWPQTGARPNPKDRIEIALHESVCKGMIPLATAQRALAVSWVTAVEDASFDQSKVCLRDDPTRCTNLHKAYDD
jgi:hypothetical protein